MISPYMDEPIDQLADLKAHELSDSYTDHVLLDGLDQLRAHQRGERVGRTVKRKALKAPTKRVVVNKAKPNSERGPDEVKLGKPSKVTPELAAAVRAATGSQEAIAKQFGIGATTVSRIQRGLIG